jgi:tRNA threonylcarbamoyladenosine biosynthesis protein TsaE
MPGKLRSASEEESFDYAVSLVRSVSPATHFLLFGDLGAGKTTFTRGLVAGFGGDPDEVSSPTFTLVNRYDGDRRIYHVDLYRIEGGGLAGLDLEEAFDDPGAAVIVEWAERLGDLAPRDAVRVFLSYLGPSQREIEVRQAAPSR